MFTVTEKASEMIRAFFETRGKVEPLRIHVAGMSCSGPQMGMSLDESNENDTLFEQDGFTFIIATELLEKAQPIEVDYLVTPDGEGFSIDHGLRQKNGCGGCTGC